MLRAAAVSIGALAMALTAATPRTRPSALPPATAPAYAATFSQSLEHRVAGRPEILHATVRIRSDGGTHTRWDSEREGQTLTTIYDFGTHTMTMFGGELPSRTAIREDLPAPISRWDMGYRTLAEAGPPPTVAGTRTVGGRQCVVLRFDTRGLGAPELCITKEGIVTLFRLRDTDGSTTTFEARQLTVGPQDSATFDLPAGYELLRGR